MFDYDVKELWGGYKHDIVLVRPCDSELRMDLGMHELRSDVSQQPS